MGGEKVSSTRRRDDDEKPVGKKKHRDSLLGKTFFPGILLDSSCSTEVNPKPKRGQLISLVSRCSIKTHQQRSIPPPIIRTRRHSNDIPRLEIKLLVDGSGVVVQSFHCCFDSKPRTKRKEPSQPSLRRVFPSSLLPSHLLTPFPIVYGAEDEP